MKVIQQKKAPCQNQKARKGTDNPITYYLQRRSADDLKNIEIDLNQKGQGIDVQKARKGKENPNKYYLHRWSANERKNIASTDSFQKKCT